MKKKIKYLIPLLILILISGCGKKDTGETNDEAVETQETHSEESSSSDIINIDILRGINFPVFKADYESASDFQPVMMNSEDDPLFYGYISEKSDGVPRNYNMNSYTKSYKTPYLYNCVSPDEAPYVYPDYNDVDFSRGVISATDRQYELYKTGSYLYEVEVPDSRKNIVTNSDGEEIEEQTSIMGTDNASTITDIIASSGSKHIQSFDMIGCYDLSNSKYALKYITIKMNMRDGSEFYGVAAALEHNDKQYFYYYGSPEERDEDFYKNLVSQITPSDNEYPTKLFDDAESRYEEKTISIDINGSAGTFNVPGYFRNEEIGGNITSLALTFIPESQRYIDNPSYYLPNTNGSEEILLKNEYLNIALTYNNYVLRDDMPTYKEFILEYFCLMSVDVEMVSRMSREDFKKQVSAEWFDKIERPDITDKDGNVWKSYYITTDYYSEYVNFPAILPYPGRALIYIKQTGNTVQMFTVSCGLVNWFNDEDFLNRFNSIPESFTASKPTTEVPSGPLTFYYMEEPEQKDSKATKTDAKEITDDIGEDGTYETVDDDIVESGSTDEDEGTDPKTLKDLGITQDDIDNAPSISDE